MTTATRHRSPRPAGAHARRPATVVIVLALLAGACTGDDGDAGGPTTSRPPALTAPEPEPITDAFAGLRLSHASSAATPAAPVPVVAGDPLDDAAAQAVLDRLPGWDPDPSIAERFRWPAETLLPPRPGTTVDAAFPPADAGPPPPEVPSGPLTVRRVQPEGEVAIAPFVTVTFDRPMVPVATVGQLDEADVPAVLEPAVPGRWQWIGTSTLRFDAAGEDRLPMATEYVLTVPAGTTSATGDALAEDVVVRFATPGPTVRSLSPEGSSLPLAPVFVATFDQRVDPQAVLGAIELRAGDDRRDVRLATAEEIEADEHARFVAATGLEGRWVAFRPTDPLPADTPITVTIAAGTPSAEGPRTSRAPVTVEGRTYGPLRIVRAGCEMGASCPPGSSIAVELSNELDLAALDPATVRIDPALPGAVVSGYGSTLLVAGPTQARTTYRITVPAALTDVYGQQLGADEDVTVEMGPAIPTLVPLAPVTTLDPFGGPELLIRSVNHDELRVRVYRVAPTELASFQRWAVEQWRSEDQDPPAPPFPVVSDEVIGVAERDDAPVETAVDLRDAFGGERGHAVVLVETTETYPRDSEEYWANRPTLTWAQATGIGLDAVADQREAVVWATDLRTGAPLAGVAVSFPGEQAEASTDADGLATLALPASPTEYDGVLVARRGDDTAVLPTFGMARTDVVDEARWYVIDDRGTYRPGETVTIKGWVRRFTRSTDGRLALLPEGSRATYRVEDPQGATLAEGEVAIDPLGGFDLTVDLPDGASTGQASVWLRLVDAGGLDGETWHPFSVQEYRRPEFEVRTQVLGDGPAVVGGGLEVEALAAYYAGGPVPGAPVAWTVTASTASFQPPGWDGFTFGRWIPWWLEEGAGARSSWPCCGEPIATETFTGTTDAAGGDRLAVEVGGLDPELVGFPVAVSAQAAVTDVNRQAWASTVDVVVHPAAVTVGLRGQRTFVRQGDPLVVDAVVTGIDGEAVAGQPVTVVASRLTSVWEDGELVEQAVDPQECTLTSGTEPQPCTFATEQGGTYEVVGSVTDGEGRTSRTELTRWVSGATALPERTVEGQALTLVPADEETAPGATTSVFVQAPFEQGEGLLTLARNGIRDTIRFTLAGGTAEVAVPVTDDDVPGVTASVEVVGTAPRRGDDGSPLAEGPPAPAYATGELLLPVSRASRTLTVTATPAEDALLPGGTTSVDVAVAGPDGSPVEGASLAIVVVDEAVLALSGYQLLDPVEVFHARTGDYLSRIASRSTISLQAPPGAGDDEGASRAAPTTAPAEEAADGDAAGGDDTAAGGPASAGSGAPIDVRTNLDALALFRPSVTTDAAGHASVEVTLPDSLTRYRVMVVAAAGAEQFGSAESTITARLPLMVRPSPPRFVNFGDAFELPVLLQNQTDAELTVDVVAQVDNLTLTGAPGLRATVPAGDRVEVRFPVAVESAGRARIRVAAVAADDPATADAQVVELPAYTPATSESFATYGVVDEGAVLQPLLAPAGVIPQFGGLDITTSSTALQGLTDAVLYVDDYRYASSDAYASRIITISSLRDVLAAFDAPDLPSPEALDTTVRADVDALVALQGDDGGFPYWQRGSGSEPFPSLFSAHALIVAREAGVAVPTGAIEAALAFARSVEQSFETGLDQDSRDALSAYGLWVRRLGGDPDPAKAGDLFGGRWEELPLDAVAWVWPVVEDPAVAAALARVVDNRAVDTAGAVSFTSEVAEGDWVTLRSDRRTDALLLDALLTVRPDSDLIPKVVTGLLAARPETGHWDSLQENVFIVAAMEHYYRAVEGEPPAFTARVWLGERLAAATEYAGRTTDRNRTTLPTTELLALGDPSITLARQPLGASTTGRLYYRIGLRTAPADLDLDPLDRGFVVQRTYEAVDDPADVTRDADGTWRIRSGARVRVRLTMVAESTRTHVALVDPLPAGLEIVNPTLAVSPAVPPEPTEPTEDGMGAGMEDGGDAIAVPRCPGELGDCWWEPQWFDHENRRDDRAEAFATWLDGGVYDYAYVTRATTPGSFVVPPSRAEERFAPETFGRSATDRVVVA